MSPCMAIHSTRDRHVLIESDLPNPVHHGLRQGTTDHWYGMCLGEVRLLFNRIMLLYILEMRFGRSEFGIRKVGGRWSKDTKLYHGVRMWCFRFSASSRLFPSHTCHRKVLVLAT